MAQKAEKRGIKVTLGKVEQLPLESGRYDLALMITVDCFLDDLLHAFKEISRILTQDGYFVIAFIDKDTTLGKLYEKKKEYNIFYKDSHIHSSKEIETFLGKADFSILERKQTIFSLENNLQEIKDGNGEGLFAVIKAKKTK